MINTFGKPIIPDNDDERVEALKRYSILDTPPEETFNTIAHIIAQVFRAPIALISLVDKERVFFKANVGMPGVKAVDRGVSLCSLAVLSPELTVYENALEEPCLLANPLVAGDFGLRFYAGAPIITQDGFMIGTVCIVDREVRSFSEPDRQLLTRFATMVMNEIELRHAARQQKEQQVQYESIFSATSDAILIYDYEGRLVEANPAACTMHGYTYGEITALSGWDLIHPDDHPKFRHFIDTVRDTQLYTVESTHVSKAGKPIAVEVKGTTFTYRERPHLLAVVRDVTQRKEVEAALHRAQTQLQAALSAGLVSTWFWDINQDKVYGDQNLARLFGVEVEQAAHGLPLDNFVNAIHPDDRARVMQLIEQAVANQAEYEAEYRVINAAGKMQWVIARGRVDYEEQTASFSGVIVDITELKLTQEALSYQNQLTRTIADNATSTLFMMDAKGYCTFMNPAGEKMFGYTFEEIRQRPLHYMIHHHRPDGSYYPMEDCPIDRALPENFDIRAHHDVFFRKDGTSFPVSCAASPIFENGVPVSTVIEVRDITRERQAQEALRKSAEELERNVQARTRELQDANERLAKSNYELEQFAYVASHDLQEPLRKIQLFGDMLHSQVSATLQPVQQDWLDKILAAAQRMSSQIKDLLEYSRLTQPRHKPQFTPVDLNKVLKNVCTDMEVEVSRKSAEVVADNLPVLEAVELQMNQIMHNLISNSLKFSAPDRKPVITITASPLAQAEQAGYQLPAENEYVKLVFRDNGIGFKPEFSEQVFEIFQRLNTKNKYPGTGIGLALCRKVADNHKGLIFADGQENQGAVFTIILPKRQTQ
ncbi:PAS domain-containing sensor histidine kinase [Nibrella viscosa]|uniref:histidine kinase n=1 Tax=Nibrella viscosa TaxID=1084524 RepID=A0ABP8KZY2_9BACT